MRALTSLKQNETAVILKMPQNTRLNELGINIGEKLTLLKVSPLKQSFLIGIRGTTIAIKRETASLIFTGENNA